MKSTKEKKQRFIISVDMGSEEERTKVHLLARRRFFMDTTTYIKHLIDNDTKKERELQDLYQTVCPKEQKDNG